MPRKTEVLTIGGRPVELRGPVDWGTREVIALWWLWIELGEPALQHAHYDPITNQIAVVVFRTVGGVDTVRGSAD